MLQGVGQRFFRQIPDFIGTDAVNAVRPGRKINFNIVKAKVFVNVQNQLNCRNTFFFHLLRRAENMGIILGKFANAHQPHQRSGSFITVDHAELSHSQRQVAIRFYPLLVNQQTARAVHRLNAEHFVIFGFARIVMSAVFVPVSGSLPQAAIHNPRRCHFNIAVVLLTLAHIFNQLAINLVTFVMPKNRARRIFRLKVEQVHFFSEFAVIAFFGFFQHF